MNILLWALQIILALHTAIGAMWKFSHSAGQTMPSLQTIPYEVWLAMSVIELLCSLGLILPLFNKRLAVLIPIAVIIIAAEMLFFSGLHIFSGAGSLGPVIYWLVVAIISLFVAYGRFSLKPLVPAIER